MTARCRGHDEQGAQRRVPPGWPAHRDGFGGWDCPPVGFQRRAGRSMPPYDRHVGEASEAAYSPDGLWVASGGTDRTVRVWGAANRQDLAILHGHTGTSANWRLRRTAVGFGESVGIARLPGGWRRCGSGRSGSRRARPYFAAIPATSIRWRTARTDNGSPRGAGTTPCACGTR